MSGENLLLWTSFGCAVWMWSVLAIIIVRFGDLFLWMGVGVPMVAIAAVGFPVLYRCIRSV